MKIPRVPYDPAALLGFFESALEGEGALCERTWYDRLEVIAEGRSAALWPEAGSLHEVELHFAPADATTARDASSEVFPGCPLTFRLSESLRPFPLQCDTFLFPTDHAAGVPDVPVIEKRWRAQFPDTVHWSLASPLVSSHHFSLVVVVRCEIQSIDQHWSLHRLALSLPSGSPDEDLARHLGFAARADQRSGGEVNWPAIDSERWGLLLRNTLAQELREELGQITGRQEKSLRRELERVDDYFAQYTRELESRHRSSASAAKLDDRLAAARDEHRRRRADQVARHEIRILPQWEAVLLVAERAWDATVTVDRAKSRETFKTQYIPRNRRFEVGRAEMS